MRRKRAFKRGPVVSIVVAGFVGYLVGGWSPTALRSTDLSAAQTVALRFPQDWDDAPAAAAAARPGAMIAGAAQFALLSPEPMVPQRSIPQPSVPQAVVAPAAAQIAAAEDARRSSAPDATSFPAAAAHLAGVAKPIAAASHRRTDRPGYMLNDAQIASIKDRLHLSPDQERMWPAVEAALRNIAYTNAREARRRGAPASATQLASADPNSVEVQGLKSAALPLIMSFNDEQKDEVRNLAHVMGLDQLATQF